VAACLTPLSPRRAASQRAPFLPGGGFFFFRLNRQLSGPLPPGKGSESSGRNEAVLRFPQPGQGTPLRQNAQNGLAPPLAPGGGNVFKPSWPQPEEYNQAPGPCSAREATDDLSKVA